MNLTGEATNGSEPACQGSLHLMPVEEPASNQLPVEKQRPGERQISMKNRSSVFVDAALRLPFRDLYRDISREGASGKAARATALGELPGRNRQAALDDG